MRNLRKNIRTRAAILIAMAYAFCVLAPSAALAFVDSPAGFHCLAELNAIAVPADEHEGKIPAHADGVVHHHDHSGLPDKHSDSDGKGHAGGCCGLFSVSALAHDPGLIFGIDAPASLALTAVAHGLAGQGPNPLHRPPIA